jgi:hemerythrin superfamily protein
MPATDLFEEIRMDHDEVKDMLDKLEQTTGSKNRGTLFEKFKQELIPHMKAEEKSLYPALAKEKSAREDALEAVEEHHVAEMVLKELDKMSKDDEKWKAKLLVFKEIVNHHIEEEEGKIFEHAREAFDEEQLEVIFEDFQKNKRSIRSRMGKRAAA